MRWLMLAAAVSCSRPVTADDDDTVGSVLTPAPEPAWAPSARKRVFWAGGVESSYAATLHSLMRNAPEAVLSEHVAAADAMLQQAGPATPEGLAPDEFVPAAGYQGERPGYLFTHGDRGLGYYLQQRARERLRHAAMLLQLSEAERTQLERAMIKANAQDVRGHACVLPTPLPLLS